MDGLIILDKFSIISVPTPWIAIMLILTIIITIVSFCDVYYRTGNEKAAMIAEFIAGITCVIITIIILSLGILKKPTGEYQYKVIISEACSFIEFNSKYEIVEKNSDGTYIIEEK